MVSASAPISKEVLEFFKVTFSVPVYEGYGLSESTGAALLTRSDDPVSGTVGGPLTTYSVRLKDRTNLGYSVQD